MATSASGSKPAARPPRATARPTGSNGPAGEAQGRGGIPFGSVLAQVVRAPWELARSLNPAREQSDLARAAFYATLAGLVVAEVLEPPLAVVVAAGHALASSRSRAGRAIGQGLEEAAA